MTPSAMYEDMVAAGRAVTQELVTVDRDDDRAIVTLRDPGKLNVLSAGLMVQLLDRTTELTIEPGLRSIVLTGENPAFSVGGDLRMMRDAVQRMDDSEDRDGATGPWRWIRGQFGAMARLIHGSDKAFIAELNGPAAGVGLAFALTCDLAIAGESALIVPAFGRIGLLPEVGTGWAITRALGYRGAFAFYASGKHLDGREAARLGLVNEVVPDAELRAATLAWCDRISALPPHALEMTKPLLRSVADMPWQQALVMEEFAEPSCFTTAAFGEAVHELLGAPRTNDAAG